MPVWTLTEGADNFPAGGPPPPDNWHNELDDIINALGGDDVIFAGAMIDTVNAGDGDDEVHGGDAGDLVYGGADDDTIFGDAGDDTLSGQSGSDIIHGNDGADTISGGVNDDTLYGDAGADFIGGDDGVDEIHGGGDGDTIITGTGSDIAHGDDGNDNFGGNSEESKAGDFDQLFGDGGDDVLITIDLAGAKATALFDGGSGTDTVRASGDIRPYSFAGVEVLENTYLIISDVARLNQFKLFTDTYAGSDQTSIFLQSTGTVDFSGRLAAGVRLNVTGFDKGNTVIGGDADDRLVGVFAATGDYVFFGGGGNDALAGGAGSDVLDGGAGNDEIDGGGGVDVATYAGAAAAVTVNLLNPNAQETGGAGKDLLINIENLVGSAFADTLTGNGADNVLTGNAGADLLSGMNGFDRLDGGAGADTMQGGADSDTYIVDQAGDVVVETAGGGTADRVMARASYTLASGADIELLTTVSSTATTAINLTGNTLRQEITGNAGANALRDGGGAGDVLRGLGGNDTYQVYSTATTIIETSTSDTADRVMAGVDYTLGAGVRVEILTTNGSTGKSAIALVGNEFAQEITGNAGDNRLEGREGNDTLRGLGGKDTFVFNRAPGTANVDTVADFNAADDRFLLSDAVYKALTPGVLAAGAFRANTSGLAQDADDRIIYETDTGKLFYDANGTGAGGGVHFATLTGMPAITNLDFVVA